MVTSLGAIDMNSAATIPASAMPATTALKRPRLAKRMSDGAIWYFSRIALIKRLGSEPGAATATVFPFRSATLVMLERTISCLLYTSDAADDLTRVDLGGR